MRAPIRLLLGVAAITTITAANPAMARTQVLKTTAGSVVHWNRAEITVGIDGSAGSHTMDRLDVVLAIQRAIRAWNQIPADQPRLRFTSEGARDVTVRFCLGVWQGDRIDLGRTQYAPSPVDGSVSTVIVELNECDHKLTPPGDEAGSPFDVQAVLTHEIGHVLGLGHSDARASIMYPSGGGTLARAPGPQDVAALASIYLGRESTAAPAGSHARHPAPSALTAGPMPPPGPPAPLDVESEESPVAGAVPVLNLKANHGRDVVIYTAEPTLLPPLATSQATPERKRRGPTPAKH
jgi:hypothetical protein